MQKHRSELATVNVTIKLVGLLNKAKKKKKKKKKVVWFSSTARP